MLDHGLGLLIRLHGPIPLAHLWNPFVNLSSPTINFIGMTTLNKSFKAPELLISNIIEGIRTFDITRKTCLQTNWSKDSIGYLLLQQHCDCNIDKAPVCCKEGWKLIYAGSRFTHETESRYSPTEGEALAVSWSLEHSKMFTLGCNNLIILTDHHPLVGIFGDKELSNINNPRIRNLKEKTLKYNFTIQYNPGKWHRSADACSRNPTKSTNPHEMENRICQIITNNPNESDKLKSNEIASFISTSIINKLDTLNVITTTTCDLIVMHEDIINTCKEDTQHQILLKTIIAGFPQSKTKLDPAIHEFWTVRDRLSAHNNIALLDDRLVIPRAIRKCALAVLHSAHQGITNMQARATATIYWPGMNANIRNTRYTCFKCNECSPSHSQELILPTPSPSYPFQMVCTDYFKEQGHFYLTYVDCFSGWLSIFHFKPHQATSQNLILEC